MSASSSAINGDPIVKHAGIAILSLGGMGGGILTVRVSGSIPSYLSTLVSGLSRSFMVSSLDTFRKEGW